MLLRRELTKPKNPLSTSQFSTFKHDVLSYRPGTKFRISEDVAGSTLIDCPHCPPTPSMDSSRRFDWRLRSYSRLPLHRRNGIEYLPRSWSDWDWHTLPPLSGETIDAYKKYNDLYVIHYSHSMGRLSFLVSSASHPSSLPNRLKALQKLCSDL